MDYRIDQLRYQLREDPSSRLFYQLAEQLRRRGEAEEASAVLRRGLELHPRYVAAWVGLGRTLGDLEDPDGAAEAFSRAYELDAGNLVAARAVADLALAEERWSAAVEVLQRMRDAIPGDDEAAAKLADAQARLAEEEEALEALTTRAIPVVRPPAQVISLSGDDPFAHEDGAEDSGASAVQDVFAIEDLLEVVAEPEIAEPFDSVEPVGAGEEETTPVAGEDAGPWVDEPFAVELEDQGDDEPEAESWADVDSDDFDGEHRVEPPEQVEAPLEEEPLEEEPVAAEEPVAEPAVPEIAEPDLEPVPDSPEEPEAESWSDIAEHHEAEVAGLEAEAGGVEDEAQGALEVVGAHEEIDPVLIPQAIAHFDRPSDEADHDEPRPVAAADVPLPTLTLARLAQQQGDLGLAEATLERLIEQDSSNSEALEFLDMLRRGHGEDQVDVTGAKVAALRGWLDTIRLASERQST
jgi:tetratricopeptide (TPR) repeat protein